MPPIAPASLKPTRAVGVGLTLSVVGAILSLLPSTFLLDEALGLGALFTVRGRLAPPSDVVVVGISRDSAQALGQTTELDTWPRELHAQLVDGLAGAGVAAIAFDLLFHEPREGPGDGLLAAAIARAGNVVLLDETGDSDVVSLGGEATGQLERRTPPLAPLKAGALGSAPFILPMVPVRLGQAWTFDRVTGDLPSLPVLALQARLLPYYDDFVRVLEQVRPGSTSRWPPTRAIVEERRELELTVGAMRRTLERDADLRAAALAEVSGGSYSAATAEALRILLDVYSGPRSRYVNFYGPARSVPTIPYDRALAGSSEIDLAGKVVFVGLSEPRQPRQQDDFYSVFSETTGINLSGVEVGATVLANLLEQRSLETVPLPLHLALVAVLGFVFGVFVGRLTMPQAAALTALGAVLYFGVAYSMFTSYYVWLPLVVPLLVQLPLGFGAAVWWNYREVTRQRERVRTALGYYVPRSLARRLTEQTVSMRADRHLLHGTCLVTDAEHYTSVAESLTPAELASLMNDYYQSIFRVVQSHGGEISDTAGDSMIAVWASAAPDATLRLRAAEASIAILDSVAEFNRAHRHAPLPTRIGLESGEMLLGNIGAEQRYEYRAIGDIVNTAARIQGLNQQLGTHVLWSDTTLEGMTQLATRDVGTFLLRGKRLPVRVLEPLGASVCRLDEQSLAAFAAALTTFRGGSWAEAQERFAALSAEFPIDGPSRYYEALSRKWRESPPESWTGAVRLTAK